MAAPAVLVLRSGQVLLPDPGSGEQWSFAEGFECNGPLCDSVKAVGHFRYWPGRASGSNRATHQDIPRRFTSPTAGHSAIGFVNGITMTGPSYVSHSSDSWSRLVQAWRTRLKPTRS